jgi:hypothetical protein
MGATGPAGPTGVTSGWVTGGGGAQAINANCATLPCFISIGEIGTSSTEGTVAATFFAGATLDNLFVYAENSASLTNTFTVFVNGTGTSLKCTMTSTNRCSLTGTSASISAGQTFSVQIGTSGSSPGSPIHFRIRVH